MTGGLFVLARDCRPEIEGINLVLLWTVFTIGVIVALSLDLGVFQRKVHKVTPKEALTWSAIWVALALLFGGYIFHQRGSASAVAFITGYVIELSLSVDNVFIFAVIFTSFRVPSKYQHRVLFWGILTAIVLRGVMIWLGTALLDRFHWAIYVFGGLLILTGIRMCFHKEESADMAENAMATWLRKHLRLTSDFHGEHFLTRIDGKIFATPLFLVMALVGPTDLMFAIDSIPAVLAISRDPFIVFTSNVFAVLGLRSMFFLLAGMMDRFHYLKVGLAAVLIFVGLKMLDVFKVRSELSLLIVGAILGTAVVFSWRRPVHDEASDVAAAARRMTRERRKGK
jgi:tellurite resistance protein TerC